ncbi:uncharacterized protein N7484_010744 [Penicillium longicatenatum]|uniref:uncharacterized protein n=1 Tax=Penicillium longicatenatum TaxID=1561947 RepID=UPI002549951B|nr:uncharacterized protein N7484_010744 [Penicillium longicatenatum]KAJ5630644.1 hypothetical protein N7484_010744 [Penicillium longicatenatum]
MRAVSILSFLALGSFTAAAQVESRSSPSESYSLYAYGEGVGGFALYYNEGNAVVGKKAPPNATEVTFSPSSSGNSMVGNPANTTGTKRSFSDQELFVPSSDSTSHQIGFTGNSSGTDKEVTNKFVWYGHFLLVEDESGEYTSLFYAKKTDYEDLYSLQWNITDEDDGEFVSVSMRSIAPSNE